VSDVRPGEKTATIAELSAVLTAEPDSAESYQAIRDLRSAVVNADPDAVVGGAVATKLGDRFWAPGPLSRPRNPYNGAVDLRTISSVASST
jgi:hypothetical protein